MGCGRRRRDVQPAGTAGPRYRGAEHGVAATAGDAVAAEQVVV